MKIRMAYRRYKEHYSDCDIVYGTYDECTKTIVVDVPEGRMKKSGVRGNSFNSYNLYVIDEEGKKCCITYRAVSFGNAVKQCKKDCKHNGWKYIGE